MTRNGTGLATRFESDRHFPSAEFDLNEAIRELADSRRDDCRTRNIAVILDLAPELPKTAADGGQLQNVLSALFLHAQEAILESGNSGGSITIRTQLNAGRMQLSISHDGVADLHGMFDLIICAQIIQDQGGELYVWRPRYSAGTTITVDLTTRGS